MPTLPENPAHGRNPRLGHNPLYGEDMPTPVQLRTEIETGPLAADLAPLWADGNDVGVAAVLNDPARRSAVFPMTVGDFANWLAGAGLLRKINDAKSHADETVASLSLLLMWKIQGDPGRTVDPRDVETQGMFAAFVAVGIALDAHVTAFTAACARSCSRAAELGWAPVTHTQVAAARDA